MKSLIVIVGLLITTNSFAKVQKAEELRLSVRAAVKNSVGLVKECSSIESLVAQQDQFLINLNNETLSLPDSGNRFLVEARNEIKNARSILYMAKEDCTNKALSRARILLEMYLVHIDTDLMIYSDLHSEK